MFKRVLIPIIAVLSISNVSGQGADGREDTQRAIRTSVPFLTIAPDSRAGAMGDVGVATSPDNSSQHWNAAKYVFKEEQAGFSATYTPWLRSLGVTDLNLLYAAGYKKFGDLQAVSASIRYFNLGEIAEINSQGIGTGTVIRPHEFAIDAAYSRKFSDYISGAMTFRFIKSDIAAGTSNLSAGAEYSPGTSYAADIAAFYSRPVIISGINSDLTFGVNISNLGAKMSYSENSDKQFIPTNLRLGGGLSLNIDDYNKIAGVLEFNKLLVPSPVPLDSLDIGVIEGVFKSFGDAQNGFKEEINEFMWSLGVEYWYMEQFAIRAGYFNEHLTKGNRKIFSAGVGMKLNVFSLDFSYLFPASGGRTNPLANTMRFTLGFRFE